MIYLFWKIYPNFAVWEGNVKIWTCLQWSWLILTIIGHAAAPKNYTPHRLELSGAERNNI